MNNIHFILLDDGFEKTKAFDKIMVDLSKHS